jgi:hypothetical protein
LAEANVHRQSGREPELPGTDERPVMQDFKDRFTDIDQLSGHKTGQLRGSVSQVQADSVQAA